MEQRWQTQVEKARKQLEREGYVDEWDKECEEASHLRSIGDLERTAEESQRLHQLRPYTGMFDGENDQARRRYKLVERYRKQDKHAVMAPNMRLAAEQKQAQMAQELELELEQELELGIEGNGGTSSGDGQEGVFVDWRG